MDGVVSWIGFEGLPGCVATPNLPFGLGCHESSCCRFPFVTCEPFVTAPGHHRMLLSVTSSAVQHKL